MKQISLGRHRLKVPVVGLSCMGMTDEREAIASIHRSLELGGNFLDTADRFGPLENERLIGKAIKGKRNQYILSTKFGYEIDDNGQLTGQINGKKAYLRKSVERSLKNLGTDYIDLYYLHRLDPNTPIEETMSEMTRLVREGKIGWVGLSEVSVETIQRAQKIHPVAAFQSEYSLFERSVEKTGMLETIKNLGIGFIAYAPLGRGFLSGDIRMKSPGDSAGPELLMEIKKMAEEKDVTASQLAIAWTIAKGSLPIPGTQRIEQLEQNMAAASLSFNADDMSRLETIQPRNNSAQRHMKDRSAVPPPSRQNML